MCGTYAAAKRDIESNLKQLATLASSSATRSERFLQLRFQGKCRAVIETARSRRIEQDVLREHEIYRWCSADVDPHSSRMPVTCATWFCGGAVD